MLDIGAFVALTTRGKRRGAPHTGNADSSATPYCPSMILRTTKQAKVKLNQFGGSLPVQLMEAPTRSSEEKAIFVKHEEKALLRVSSKHKTKERQDANAIFGGDARISV